MDNKVILYILILALYFVKRLDRAKNALYFNCKHNFSLKAQNKSETKLTPSVLKQDPNTKFKKNEHFNETTQNTTRNSVKNLNKKKSAFF